MSDLDVVIVAGGAQQKFFHPPTGAEIWGLNALRPEWVPYWSRMFNLHMFEHLERDWPEGLEREKGWLTANPTVPFYTCDPWPEWAVGQRRLPREELAKIPRGNYHAISLDWMVAFALHLGARAIGLHGVRLVMRGDEPISARPCLEYWCGYAEGRGVTVTVAPDCDIFLQYHLVKSRTLYGYDDIRLVEDRP